MNEIPEEPDDPVRLLVRPAMSLSPPPNGNVYFILLQPAFWGSNIKKIIFIKSFVWKMLFSSTTKVLINHNSHFVKAFFAQYVVTRWPTKHISLSWRKNKLHHLSNFPQPKTSIRYNIIHQRIVCCQITYWHLGIV